MLCAFSSQGHPLVTTTPSPSQLSGAEARQSERVTINKEFASFDSFLSEYVTNISRSGVFIKSKTPLEIGTLVNLRFTVIMDDIETIEGVGEVVRVEEEPTGMGIVFREVSPHSREVLDRLLSGKK